MSPLPHNRPAVSWALCLLAGMVLAQAGWLPRQLVALSVSLLAMGGVRAIRGRSVRLAALALTAALGAWLFHEASDGGRARIRGWLPEDGSPVELHLRGRLLDIPETGRDGERTLRIAARPECHGEGQPARILLRVRGSAHEATLRLDSLRPGDLVRVWCKVRRPRRARDPDQADPETALLARGQDAIGTVKNAHLVALLERGPSSARSLLGSFKASVRARLDRAVGGGTRSRAVLGAMLLGDRAALDPRDARVLRDAGLVHLLSISGLHVGLAVAAFLAMVGRTPIGPLGVFATLLTAIAAIAVVTGGQPPVLRSALSAGLMLLGRAVGRDGDALNTLAVVTAGLAVLRPHILWDPSFQLTVTATAGLLAFSRSLASTLPLPRVIALSVGLSASAYLASVPWTLLHFGRATPASILSNLGASILCALSLASGSMAAAAADVPVIGEWLGRAAEGSVSALLGFASAMARIPCGSFRVGSPPIATVVGYFGLLFLAAHPAGFRLLGPGRRPAVSRLLRLAICLVLGLLHFGAPPPGPSRSSEVAVLDVGQGQAVVLRGPSGGFLLVDAGGTAGGRFDSGERTVAPFLARRGCRRLEALVLSHDHDDHVGGAETILRDFDVAELWLAPGAHRSKTVGALADLAAEKGTALVLVERGFHTARAGMEMEVLHPTRHGSSLSENDRSVVVLAAAAGSSVLVPGDLESPGEDELLSRDGSLRADALIVGHHGASRASGARFLDAVSPSVAVISVGEGNRFGHPDPEVLARLRRRGVAVFRTDRDGRVLLRSTRSLWRAEPSLRGARSGPG